MTLCSATLRNYRLCSRAWTCHCNSHCLEWNDNARKSSLITGWRTASTDGNSLRLLKELHNLPKRGTKQCLMHPRHRTRDWPASYRHSTQERLHS